MLERDRKRHRDEPRTIASDFPIGSKVAFKHRGHTIYGTSQGNDGGSDLRLVVREDDGPNWIVEAHTVTRRT